MAPTAATDFERAHANCAFGTVLADPPWQFTNRTGKVAPEHRRLSRYATLSQAEIAAIPVASACAEAAHLYLWVPNALLQEGLDVMKRWGFTYKTNLVWHKVRKDGGPDGRGVGFYFRNTTELVLFGVRGKLRTLAPGRRQVNIIRTRKREHSRKPDELYDIIEACSPGPYVELFARGRHSESLDRLGRPEQRVRTGLAYVRERERRRPLKETTMCRNIRVLYNFEPPANDEEVRAAALQYVRKVSGSTKPSRANEAAFEQAVDAVADATARLLRELTTTAPPRNREVEAEKARERWRRRQKRIVATG